MAMDLRKLLSHPGWLIGAWMFLVTLFPSGGGAQLGSDNPTNEVLQAQRARELETGLMVEIPVPGTILRPVQRVPRERFGVVSPLPLGLRDLAALVFPDATHEEREALVEGLDFFTTLHTAEQGAGPVGNQTRCQGCHLSSREAISGAGLVRTDSSVSRGARSTPTNFRFTSGDAENGGRAADHLDAINDTGLTAAFTIFGDYSPSTNVFDPLDGAATTIRFNPDTGMFETNIQISGQQFGGFVQHTRPTVEACLPDRLPTIEEDLNLGTIDPETGLSPSGFRRSVGERAAPPYIGRGLMEAIPNQDIVDQEDPDDEVGAASSLHSSTFDCTGDCITGRHNIIPPSAAFVGLREDEDPLRAVGRFGLRANGAEILQFVAGGLQGELGFTSLLNLNDINFEMSDALDNEGCRDDMIPPGFPDPDPAPGEVNLSTPFSERNFLRMTAPPEFGDTLLRLLTSSDPERPRHEDRHIGQVQRGAMLFGIDLTAFANRMIPGRMPEGGDDGLDPHAINQSDRMVGCVGCHTPVQRTGLSPAQGRDFQIVARHVSFVWAPIFADLLLHAGPVINAERFATTPRDPLVIRRADLNGDSRSFNTFDLPRNLADDAFSSQQAAAFGPEFRTAPLMGMGRMGPPFLHDARVYLSRLTRDSFPAGTVMTNSQVTNAPLVVRTLDDAIRAAIELHDLPAPDDERTPDLPGAGCPVPPDGSGTVGNVNYGPSPAAVICPSYDSELSQTHRSAAREVIRRFRSLSPEDQQALIEFLKEL
jgi:hypothetical protein